MKNVNFRRLALSTAIATLFSGSLIASDFSECNSAYRQAGAIPGTTSCKYLAFGALVTLANYNCKTNRLFPTWDACWNGRQNDDVCRVIIPQYCGDMGNAAGNQCSNTGNPIEIFSGNKFKNEDDLIATEALPDGFKRYFNSRLSAGSRSIGDRWRHSYSLDLNLGAGGENGVPGAVVAFTAADGQLHTLTGSLTGSYSSYYDSEVVSRLTAYQGGDRMMAVRRPKEKKLEVFDHKPLVSGANGYADNGRLVESWQANGRYISISRGVNGEIQTIKDALTNRGLLFEYYLDSANKPIAIKAMVAPGGGRYVYGYEPAIPNSFNARLISVNKPFKIDQDSVRNYFYHEPDYAPISDGYFLALTGIQDQGFPRHSVYRYSSEVGYVGRAIASELGGGLVVEKVSSLMPIDSEWEKYESMQTVTWPNGVVSDVLVWRLDGRNRVGNQTKPAGAGCSATEAGLGLSEFVISGSNTVVDVSRSVDFNQNLKCFDREGVNGRLRESKRVMGLAATSSAEGNKAICEPNLTASALTPGVTKISSKWHDDWDLLVKSAEPGKIVSHVYNGQIDPETNASLVCAPADAKLPDGKPIAVLCKTIEEETTDLTGALGFSASRVSPANKRVTTFSYNKWGQLVYRDGPRVGLIDREQWAYYSTATAGKNAVGDLYTYTDAAGNVTTYVKYNDAGQPLEVLDANNVQTTYTYDLRQRIASVDVAGQKTQYEYDAAGRLSKVTQPDNSFVTLEYDAAYRLKAAVDSIGNRIDYTLDGAGTVRAESTYDKNGVLRRVLNKTVDALGRVSGLDGLPQ